VSTPATRNATEVEAESSAHPPGSSSRRPETLGAWAEAIVPELRVSAQTGAGLSELKSAVLGVLRGDVQAAVTAASERHVAAVQRCADALTRAAEALQVSTLEAAAGEVGMALEALGEITGENTSEALLDEIFRRFCVGK
jgi:tRNA modification GTPase